MDQDPDPQFVDLDDESDPEIFLPSAADKSVCEGDF